MWVSAKELIVVPLYLPIILRLLPVVTVQIDASPKYFFGKDHTSLTLLTTPDDVDTEIGEISNLFRQVSDVHGSVLWTLRT